MISWTKIVWTLVTSVTLGSLLAAPVISSALAVLGDSLGQPAASGVTQADTTFSQYKRRDLVLGKSKVRQFAATKDGIIFAISWSGRVNEAIKQLFGPYAGDLEAYDQTHHHRAGRIPYRKVNAGRIVFEFWDAPRMLKGRAYLPKQMPATVTAENIN